MHHVCSLGSIEPVHFTFNIRVAEVDTSSVNTDLHFIDSARVRIRLKGESFQKCFSTGHKESRLLRAHRPIGMRAQHIAGDESIQRIYVHAVVDVAAEPQILIFLSESIYSDIGEGQEGHTSTMITKFLTNIGQTSHGSECLAAASTGNY